MPVFKASNLSNANKYAAQVRCSCGIITNIYGYNEDLFMVCRAAIDAWNNKKDLIYK